MATLSLAQGALMDRSTVIDLVRQAVALNTAFGDPTRIQVNG